MGECYFCDICEIPIPDIEDETLVEINYLQDKYIIENQILRLDGDTYTPIDICQDCFIKFLNLYMKNAK